VNGTPKVSLVNDDAALTAIPKATMRFCECFHTLKLKKREIHSPDSRLLFLLKIVSSKI
jgi:hypothetical protein